MATRKTKTTKPAKNKTTGAEGSGRRGGRRGRRPREDEAPEKTTMPAQAKEPATETPPASPRPDGAPVYRVLGLDAALWDGLVETARGRKTSTRALIRMALDEDLPAVLQALQAAGLGPDQPQKRIRASLDEQIIDTLNTAKEAVGLPGIRLLQLTIARFLARRGGVA